MHFSLSFPLPSIGVVQGLIFGSLLFSAQLYSQQTYIPLESSAKLETELITECRSEVESLLENKEIKRNKVYRDFISERHSVIATNIQQDKYLFDGYFHQRCRKILDKLTAADSTAKVKVKDILVGRSFVPNAYCYGNGILVINLGLISRFQNDDQMAYVIAHELAHQLLDHVDTKVKKRIAYYESKEYKKSIREIKRMEYNKYSEYESFMLEHELNSRSYSRQAENQADSLAVVLMKKAGYNPTAALEALAILDQSDLSIYNDTIKFSAHLSNKGFEFNSKWLLKTDGLKLEQKIDQELVDSLKTHPDCKKRASRLAVLFDLDSKAKSKRDSLYTEIQYKALMEKIQYSLSIKRYALALTESLQMLNHFPENRYLKSTVGICLAEIYFAQGEHRLREHVPRPDDDYEYNYHQILLLVENIRLGDLKKMALSYMENQNTSWKKETVEAEQHLIYHQYLYNKLKGDTATNFYKDIYLEHFPDGYFTYSFN